MGRKRVEINPVRGQRLRQLLSERGVSQQDLADKIGYTKEHISYIINGKRTLTTDAAEAIVASCLFQGIRIEWLLGYDDYKTNRDREMGPISDSVVALQHKKAAFAVYANLAGYNISLKDESKYKNLSESDFWTSSSAQKKEMFFEIANNLDKIFYIFTDEHGKEQAQISAIEYEAIVNEIAEFAEFKIQKLCQRRGES